MELRDDMSAKEFEDKMKDRLIFLDPSESELVGVKLVFSDGNNKESIKHEPKEE